MKNKEGDIGKERRGRNEEKKFKEVRDTIGKLGVQNR